jgi:hypothetical protein
MALFKSLSYETDEVLASATDAARPAKQ